MDVISNQVVDEDKCGEFLISSPLKKNEKQISQLITQIPDIDKYFNIHRKIGQGTFSTVFLASLRCHQSIPPNQREYFAVKHLIPTSHPSRVEKELKCLQQIGGCSNVIGIDLCLRNYESVAFVMPYAPHDKFQDFYDNLTPKETKNYIKNLLIALQRVHSFNIIHRDVKPSNFLFDRKNCEYLLVDFGLAQELNINYDNICKLDISKVEETPVGDEEIGADEEVNVNYKRKLENDDANEINIEEEMKVGDIDSKNQLNDKSSQNIIPALKRARYSTTIVPKLDNLENSPQNIQSTRQQVINNNMSPFKTPLKQFNEILIKSSNNNNNKSSIYSPSPIETNVKSAVLGFKLNNLMKKEKAATPPPSKYNTDNRKLASSTPTCFCYGKNMICNICVILKKEMIASRAGTPGYRPPEVLLKSNEQDTGVDIWSAGVILISILSKCYPFFKATDDFTALAEILTVFGDEKIKKTARSLKRHISISCKKEPLHLRKLCVRLRNRFNKKTDNDLKTNSDQQSTTPPPQEQSCFNCQQIPMECLCANSTLNTDFSNDEYSELAYDLLSKLLEVNPRQRISASEALEHPYFKET